MTFALSLLPRLLFRRLRLVVALKHFGNTLFVITDCWGDCGARGSAAGAESGGKVVGGGQRSACSCRNAVDFICVSLLLFVCAAAARRFYLFYFYTHACVLCIRMCECVFLPFFVKIMMAARGKWKLP